MLKYSSFYWVSLSYISMWSLYLAVGSPWSILDQRFLLRQPCCCCCCCWVTSVASDSVRPHWRQPTRLPVPGILQARTLEWVAISFSNAWKWKVKASRSVVSNSQRPHGLQPTRLLHPWDFPGKSTGVGCHCLLQRQPSLSATLNQTSPTFLTFLGRWRCFCLC